MNLVQTFRRIGQLSGWSKAFERQEYQLPLIKKLYSKNGLEIKLTCGGCPEQYDVLKDGNKVAYLRLRHGEFSVRHPDASGEEIMYEEPFGDGIFNDNERLIYLSKAMREIILRISKPNN